MGSSDQAEPEKSNLLGLRDPTYVRLPSHTRNEPMLRKNLRRVCITVALELHSQKDYLHNQDKTCKPLSIEPRRLLTSDETRVQC